ncbi:MAG: dTDP-3-amino-3,6-dideoxy-alpha-D-galactopyranose transaminase [candidate division BRC1 bacterium ADurb.BinA364]|nr:MAG: dTDP-3-amino-3,6-dideoxy-alpha-D-galactopyranose transaminase [candidate division BRC1 bacterium ADurb.BinA364]
MATLNDESLARRLRMLANHGREGKYEHELLGYNYRLDALQAAILSVKLKRLAEWNAKRLDLARRYNAAFRGMDIVTPEAPDGHVFHLYVIRSKKREALQSALKAEGISTGVHYPIPCHRQPCCRQYNAPALPVTERIAAEIVSLPLYPEMTAAQQDRIIACLKRFA